MYHETHDKTDILIYQEGMRAMKDIKWFDARENEDGIQTIAFKDLGKHIPNVGETIGYNDILKGESVLYKGEQYTVVMVSRLGDFGLSKTGDLPYIKRVSPAEVVKI